MSDEWFPNPPDPQEEAMGECVDLAKELLPILERFPSLLKRVPSGHLMYPVPHVFRNAPRDVAYRFAVAGCELLEQAQRAMKHLSDEDPS